MFEVTLVLNQRDWCLSVRYHLVYLIIFKCMIMQLSFNPRYNDLSLKVTCNLTNMNNYVTLVTIQGRGSNFGFSGIVQRQ